MAEMRQLLLDHGASESQEQRDRWVTKQRAHLFERIRIREPRVDVRAYDPCGAAMDNVMNL